ncbi:MAG TPA: leucyl aminopeptidase [Tepidisphaeraceae bacterium]|jgi:leucyl aminopeptidase|nr:leucyl aminopeptidase [Tepidisphaeraceae bacterium]
MMPTTTRVTIQIKPQIPAVTDALALLIPEGTTTAPSSLSSEDSRAVARLLSGGVLTGKPREIGMDLVDLPKGKLRRIFVVGLGPADKLTPESLRQSIGALIRAAKKQKISSLSLLLPESKISPADTAAAITSAAILSHFEYTEYKGTATKRDPAKSEPSLTLTIVTTANVKDAVDRACIIAQGANFARTIASRPGNDINPPSLAKVAADLAKSTGLSLKTLDEKELKRLGMGGILAVGAGSKSTPPRMIVLEHKGAKKSSRPLLVIGKAITFDTGGISIKPADKMGRMIFDKSGGMAVLGLMYALAKLKHPAHVVGILSSAENHISDTAYRPGDILRMYNGVTVEVTNTDAEGRLVLADALAWGIETYKPSAVVDLATLTGGCVVALGLTTAGIMSNNDALVSQLISAGEKSGEKMWRLPVGDEHRELLKSEPADIINAAGRHASALTAAAFLSYFVPRDNSVPWAHLDIAGVADTEKELPYLSKGSTGWGVRTLVEWINSQSQ